MAAVFFIAFLTLWGHFTYLLIGLLRPLLPSAACGDTIDVCSKVPRDHVPGQMEQASSKAGLGSSAHVGPLSELATAEARAEACRGWALELDT